jgi:hypothetical protein
MKTSEKTIDSLLERIDDMKTVAMPAGTVYEMTISMHQVEAMLDDVLRCKELEEDGHTRGACWQCGEGILEFYCVCLGCHKKELARISELESALRNVDETREAFEKYGKNNDFVNSMTKLLRSACAEVKK